MRKRFNKKRYLIIILIVFVGFLLFYSNWSVDLDSMATEAYLQNDFSGEFPPKEFKSDGCSMWPDSDWAECCVKHDLIYWFGGESEKRKSADKNLSECVNSVGHPILSKVMYVGVRIAGVGWIPTPFRWGFGWDYPQTKQK